MVPDALKELREWQRQRAGEQDRAVRAAAKAWKRLDDLECEREATVGTVAAMVAELEATGVSRDQAAAFIGVTAERLGSVLAAARRGGRGPRPQSDLHRVLETDRPANQSSS